MTTTARTLSQDEAVAELRRWWQELEKAKGDRAALRRCGDLTEVVLVPAYHRLYAAVAPHGWTDRLGVAAIAGLVSLVRDDVAAGSLARQMAQAKPGSSSARISGLRFRRLLKHQDREALFPALARVVRALDGRVNLADLAKAAYWWSGRSRDRICQDWAFDYYDGAPQEQ